MVKTVNDVIRDFNVQALQAELVRLHEVGTPRLIIETLKSELENVKVGTPKVKGMSRKHQIGDETVEWVYAGTGEAKNYALPHHGTPTATTILFMVLTDGNEYYYDYFNNVIADSLDGLNLATPPEEWKPWIMTGERDDDSRYWMVTYRFNMFQNTPVITTTVSAATASKAKAFIKKHYTPEGATNTAVEILAVQKITKQVAVDNGWSVQA